MLDVQNIIIEPKPEIIDHQTIENNYMLSVDSSLLTPISLWYDKTQMIEIHQNYVHQFYILMHSN